MASPRFYTEEDDAVLRAMTGARYSRAVIADALGRDEKSVKKRQERLGLTHHPAPRDNWKPRRYGGTRLS